MTRSAVEPSAESVDRACPAAPSPLRLRSRASLVATDCLSLDLRLKDAEPKARYVVGIDVSGASDVREQSQPLGTVRTDERGKARFQHVLSLAPGSYDAQVWVAPRTAARAPAEANARVPLGDMQRVVVADRGTDTARYLRIRTHPRAVRGARRVITSAYESAAAGHELRRLVRVMPELAEYPALAAESRRVLEPYRREYLAGVSTDIMSISLELAVFLRVLCKVRNPRRIVDLGSGFSSFVLRHHAAETTPAPVVWSVDDSAAWLERTGEFLSAHDLPADNLTTWDAFIARSRDEFDLVLDDLGSPPTRTATLPSALRLIGSDGIVVIDDMHKPWYRPYARRVVREAGLRYVSSRKLTIDNFGRYAAVAVR